MSACLGSTNDKREKETANALQVDTIENVYAECFRIIEFKSHKRIEVLNPETGGVDYSYSVGENKNLDKIERIVALSATHLGMINALDARNKVVGISSDKYLCDSLFSQKVEKNEVKAIGDIGMGDVEGYLSVNPDLIIVSGFNPDAPILKKMKTAGLKTFTNYDWKETHPLGRAEWVIVMGILLNKEAQAKELFKSIGERYHSIKEQVVNIDRKPSVLVGTMYGDIFNAPAGNSYMAKLLKDAGANYVYSATDGTASLSIPIEQVITENRRTDYWLNASAASKKGVIAMSEKFELLKAVETGSIYSYTKNVNCFWEESAIKPDQILLEIAQILHPQLFQESIQPTYYHSLN